MEARDGAAGHDDEEHGPDVLVVVRPGYKPFEGGKDDIEVLPPSHEHADGADDHGKVEEIGSEIVSGLKEKPHGKDGGKDDVDGEDPAPGFHGLREDRCNPGGIVAVPAGADDDGNHDDGHEPQGCSVLVDQHAKDDRKTDIEGPREGNCGVSRKGVCGELKENRDNENQRKDGEAEEKDLALPADPLVHHFTHGLAVMAHGGDEGAHVMGAAEEGGADETPQIGGEPSEHGRRGDGPDDGSCSGDGGKMVPQKNGRVGRAVVDAVEHGFGGGLGTVIEIVDSRHIGAVDLITNSKQDNGTDKQHSKHCVHLRL